MSAPKQSGYYPQAETQVSFPTGASLDDLGQDAYKALVTPDGQINYNLIAQLHVRILRDLRGATTNKPEQEAKKLVNYLVKNYGFDRSVSMNMANQIVDSFKKDGFIDKNGVMQIAQPPLNNLSQDLKESRLVTSNFLLQMNRLFNSFQSDTTFYQALTMLNSVKASGLNDGIFAQLLKTSMGTSYHETQGGRGNFPPGPPSLSWWQGDIAGAITGLRIGLTGGPEGGALGALVGLGIGSLCA